MIEIMIDSKQSLRALYPPAKERSLKKQLGRLDKHCLRFVELVQTDEGTGSVRLFFQ